MLTTAIYNDVFEKECRKLYREVYAQVIGATAIQMASKKSAETAKAQAAMAVQDYIAEYGANVIARPSAF